jgi:hypothetical protein
MEEHLDKIIRAWYESSIHKFHLYKQEKRHERRSPMYTAKVFGDLFSA